MGIQGINIARLQSVIDYGRNNLTVNNLKLVQDFTLKYVKGNPLTVMTVAAAAVLLYDSRVDNGVLGSAKALLDKKVTKLELEAKDTKEANSAATELLKTTNSAATKLLDGQIARQLLELANLQEANSALIEVARVNDPDPKLREKLTAALSLLEMNVGPSETLSWSQLEERFKALVNESKAAREGEFESKDQLLAISKLFDASLEEALSVDEIRQALEQRVQAADHLTETLEKRETLLLKAKSQLEEMQATLLETKGAYSAKAADLEIANTQLQAIAKGLAPSNGVTVSAEEIAGILESKKEEVGKELKRLQGLLDKSKEDLKGQVANNAALFQSSSLKEKEATKLLEEQRVQLALLKEQAICKGQELVTSGDQQLALSKKVESLEEQVTSQNLQLRAASVHQLALTKLLVDPSATEVVENGEIVGAIKALQQQKAQSVFPSALDLGEDSGDESNRMLVLASSTQHSPMPSTTRSPFTARKGVSFRLQGTPTGTGGGTSGQNHMSQMFYGQSPGRSPLPSILPSTVERRSKRPQTPSAKARDLAEEKRLKAVKKKATAAQRKSEGGTRASARLKSNNA
jgi:hypothetical protein